MEDIYICSLNGICYNITYKLFTKIIETYLIICPCVSQQKHRKPRRRRNLSFLIVKANTHKYQSRDMSRPLCSPALMPALSISIQSIFYRYEIKYCKKETVFWKLKASRQLNNYETL